MAVVGRLVVLTGASGSGKTTIAEAVASWHPGIAEVLRFDRVGVPTEEEMVASWGSGEAWQRATTLEWMSRVAAVLARGRPVLFEGQARIAFLHEGIARAGIRAHRILLADCDDETRARRLVTERRQPELANPTMIAWAKYPGRRRGWAATRCWTRPRCRSRPASSESWVTWCHDGKGVRQDGHGAPAARPRHPSGRAIVCELNGHPSQKRRTGTCRRERLDAGEAVVAAGLAYNCPNSAGTTTPCS